MSRADSAPEKELPLVNQLFRAEIPRLSRRAAAVAFAEPPLEPGVVVVSWSSLVDSGNLSVGSTNQLELLRSAALGWTCSGFAQDSWVDAISASRCSEVLLTALVDDSTDSKHQVLELAGLLTRQLERTKPVVRVRFVPRPLAIRRSRRR